MKDRKADKAMAVMDEFKKEREMMKSRTPKEKFAYFWDYHKWHVIGTAAVLIFVISYIHNVVTAKDTAFYAVLINSVSVEDTDPYMQEYAEYAGIDLEEYDILFDSSMVIQKDTNDEMSYTYMQKLMAYTAAAELDAMITGDETFRQYAYNENFHDLRNILTAEQLEKYEPYFYYIDYKIVEETEKAIDEWDESYVPDYPDSTNPDVMEQPIPVGIYVDSSAKLKEYYGFAEGIGVLGIYGNTQRLENTLKYLDFVMQE